MCVLQTKSLRASATVSRSATGALLVAGGVCAPAPLGKTEAAAATAIKMNRRSLHGRPAMRLLPAVIINALHARAKPYRPYRLHDTRVFIRRQAQTPIRPQPP